MTAAMTRPADMAVVGIGDGLFSSDIGHVVRTYGLGSCIAVSFHDPMQNVGGLIHVALPESKLNPDLARHKPYHFADTAIPLAVEAMSKLGATRRKSKWRIKLAGGAHVLTSSTTFEIGRRNHAAVRRALWALGMAPIAEHCGGSESRTVTITIGRPEVEVYIGHHERIHI